MKKVTFADDSQLHTIGIRAFDACTGLESIELPASVTNIGEEAFHWNERLTTVTIAENSQLHMIGKGAFSGCHDLSSFTIPSGVTTFKECTFYDCKAMTRIVIPHSITTLEGSVFLGCNSLTDIHYNGSESDWDTIDIYNTNGNVNEKYTIHYYSETQPSAPGNWWYYVDGLPTAW